MDVLYMIGRGLFPKSALSMKKKTAQSAKYTQLIKCCGSFVCKNLRHEKSNKANNPFL